MSMLSISVEAEGLGSESQWKWWARGLGFFHENFSQFHPFLLLKKSYFSSVWHGSLSRWPPFEHSSTKMSSLDIELLYPTLCPSITSTRSTSKFHLNMFQYSVEGDVMTDTITCGQDCTLLCVKNQRTRRSHKLLGNV